MQSQPESSTSTPGSYQSEDLSEAELLPTVPNPANVRTQQFESFLRSIERHNANFSNLQPTNTPPPLTPNPLNPPTPALPIPSPQPPMADLAEQIAELQAQLAAAQLALAQSQQQAAQNSIDPWKKMASVLKGKAPVQKPNNFDGTNFQEWWLGVMLFLRAHDDEVSDDSQKILTVLSYMTKGHAQKWAQWYVAKTGDEEVTWTSFHKEIQESFDTTHVEEERAIEKILAVQLNGRTAEQFFAEFDLWSQQAKWTGASFDKTRITILQRTFPEWLVVLVQAM